MDSKSSSGPVAQALLALCVCVCVCVCVLAHLCVVFFKPDYVKPIRGKYVAVYVAAHRCPHCGKLTRSSLKRTSGSRLRTWALRWSFAQRTRSRPRSTRTLLAHSGSAAPVPFEDRLPAILHRSLPLLIGCCPRFHCSVTVGRRRCVSVLLVLVGSGRFDTPTPSHRRVHV